MGERLIVDDGSLVKYATPIIVAKQGEKTERQAAKVFFPKIYNINNSTYSTFIRNPLKRKPVLKSKKLDPISKRF